jgi:hypothetical protein
MSPLHAVPISRNGRKARGVENHLQVARKTRLHEPPAISHAKVLASGGIGEQVNPAGDAAWGQRKEPAVTNGATAQPGLEREMKMLTGIPSSLKLGWSVLKMI